MSISREKNFTHDNRTLSIRAELKETTWTVRIFDNERPATHVEYSVSHEIAHDALPMDIVAQLIDVAENDIKRGWVKLIEI